MDQQLKDKILSKIKPNKADLDNFKDVSAEFIKKINPQLRDAEAILGGSGAKDTWLAGNHDVDVFVLFDYQKYAKKSDEISEILGNNLKKAFPKEEIQRLHGSRDYFQLNYKKIAFEVIPILKIKKAEKAVNITDISPLHCWWVNKEGSKLKDEIRLAKQFCKANSIYGAESYISGFSGYGLEILTIFYRSFENLLKASLSWKVKEVIDPSGYYKNKDALFYLNQSKTKSPLIIVDPVDKNRNAAAALGEEKFLKFKRLAKEFLKNPNLDFFEKKNIDYLKLKKEVEKKKHNLVWIELQIEEGKEDVEGAKLVKGFEFLSEKLKAFSLLDAKWNWNKQEKAIVYFILEKKELAHYEIRVGPPLKLSEFVLNFKKKNKDCYEEKGRILAKVKVANPKLGDYVKSSLKEEYFLSKIKKVEKVRLA